MSITSRITSGVAAATLIAGCGNPEIGNHNSAPGVVLPEVEIDNNSAQRSAVPLFTDVAPIFEGAIYQNSAANNQTFDAIDDETINAEVDNDNEG